MKSGFSDVFFVISAGALEAGSNLLDCADCVVQLGVRTYSVRRAIWTEHVRTLNDAINAIELVRVRLHANRASMRTLRNMLNLPGARGRLSRV